MGTTPCGRVPAGISDAAGESAPAPPVPARRKTSTIAEANRRGAHEIVLGTCTDGVCLISAFPGTYFWSAKFGQLAACVSESKEDCRPAGHSSAKAAEMGKRSMANARHRCAGLAIAAV